MKLSENTKQPRRASTSLKHDWSNYGGMTDQLLDGLFKLFKGIRDDMKRKKLHRLIKALMADPIQHMYMSQKEMIQHKENLMLEIYEQDNKNQGNKNKILLAFEQAFSKAEARYQNIERFNEEMRRKRNFKKYISDPDQIQGYLNSNETYKEIIKK